MQLPSIFIMICAIWALLVIVTHLGRLGLALIHPYFQSRRQSRRDQPPISILIPIDRLEPDLEETLFSVYSQNYPEFEVLICSNSKAEEVIEAIGKISSSFPQIPTHFVASTDQIALNPKVNNLAPAFDAASFDLLLIKDSNIKLPPDQLSSMTQALTPATGLVCTIPIAINPQGFAADIEQAFMTGHAATSVLAGSMMGINIGYGKVMMFNRQDFEHAGGLPIISNTFGDDHALAKAFARNGLKTVYSRKEVTQTLYSKGLAEVWNRQLRWMVIRRDEEFFAYIFEPFIGGTLTIAVGTIGAAMMSIPWWLAAPCLAAAWIVPEMLTLAIKGWPFSWRYPLAVIFRDLMIWTLWGKAWVTSRVSWDGQTHKVAGKVR